MSKGWGLTRASLTLAPFSPILPPYRWILVPKGSRPAADGTSYQLSMIHG
jgi:hypothetical protein